MGLQFAFALVAGLLLSLLWSWALRALGHRRMLTENERAVSEAMELALSLRKLRGERSKMPGGEAEFKRGIQHISMLSTSPSTARKVLEHVQDVAESKEVVKLSEKACEVLTERFPRGSTRGRSRRQLAETHR
ncbi:MAG: hypothetical protein IMY84_03720 [Chloroflexi bacterium]|nr:hypothetical protein [Chloroflexota bacterium]